MPSLLLEEAVARERILTVDHYRIDLDLTLGEDVFGSTTTIRFRCREPGSSTFLDLKPHRLQRVLLNGRDVDPATLQDGRLPLTGLEAANELEVWANMAYRNDGEGLHRSVDTADDRVYLYAMSFLDSAPRIFACFDQPDLKAPFAVTVTAPPDWTVVGNGPATPVAPGRWQIAETKPLSTYLVTLVAGPYHSIRSEHDGIPLGLHVKQSLAEHLDREADEILAVTRQSFDELHRLFGIRYPFGEYHQAFVPEFNAGAMENPGCVTLRDQMIYRSAVTRGERVLRACVIAHEMAHQWFGDLVTMRWWDDLWLNESFAEYMGYRVTADATEFENAWADFSFSRKRWGMAADRRSTTHPVAGNGAVDAASALQDFDGISYAKGAASLKQVAAYLGDRVFLDGVRRHLDRHAYGNATWADLRRAWAEFGGDGIYAWAESWLRTTGADTLAASENDGAVVVRRTPPSGSDTQRPHAMRVGAVSPDGDVRETSVVIDRYEARVELPDRTTHPYLLLDVRDDTWAKVRMDDTTLAGLPMLLPRLRDPVVRAGAWNSLTYAVEDAELDPVRMLDVLEAALPHEVEDIAVTSMLGWTTQDLRGRYLPVGSAATTRIERLAHACLENAEPGSAAQLAAGRAVVATSGDPTMLRSWLDGGAPAGLPIDVDMRWALVLRLARLGAVDEDAIAAEQERDGSDAGVVHAARCRAALPSADAKAKAWDLIFNDDKASNYLVYAACEGFWSPEQSGLTEPYVLRYFREVPAMAELRSGIVVMMAARRAFPAYAVDEHTVERAEETLSGDLKPVLRRTISDCTDDLRRALAVRRRFA
ncbi:MAG: aminopeptidase N [Propionibacteriales bacterium]|nr:aminopeptidase N [Propionibacteriales bacterium]